MGIKNGMSAATALIDKYINTAYDTVKTVADNIDAITTASTLIGTFFASASVPTERPTGSALEEGDRYYNTGNDITYVWNGTSWQPEGVNATTVEIQEATASQTIFTLTNPYKLNSNNLLVFVNSAYQISKSVNSSLGSYWENTTNKITFDTGLNAGDVVTFVIGTPISDVTATLTKTKLRATIGSGDSKTVVNIPGGNIYEPFSNNLDVYVNGIYQIDLATDATNGSYEETSTTSITFQEALNTGDIVDFTITSLSI